MDKFSLGEIAEKFKAELEKRGLVGTGKIDIFNLEEASITEIFSALLPYVFALAGLMLFGAIIWSGFQFLTSGGDPKKTEEAKGCLTSAVVGFLIIFLSWWIIQILEIIFHVNILG